MKRLAFLLALAVTPALAQQQPDPAFLQKVIGPLQQQRNEALDKQAAAEARRDMLADEVAALKKQLEEATKKAAPEQPAK